VTVCCCSLYIHIANCQKKWLAREEDKPKRERRKLPAPPQEIADGNLPSGVEEIDAFNQRMVEYWCATYLKQFGVPCVGY
jgi:hypothetical protein